MTYTRARKIVILINLPGSQVIFLPKRWMPFGAVAKWDYQGTRRGGPSFGGMGEVLEYAWVLTDAEPSSGRV